VTRFPPGEPAEAGGNLATRPDVASWPVTGVLASEGQ